MITVMKDNKKNTSKVFYDILTEYEERVPGENLNLFLEKQLEKFGVYSGESAKKVIEDISDTIDMIDEKHNDLIHSKKNGKSRQQWIEDEINGISKSYNTESPTDLLNGLKHSFSETNNQFLKDIFDDIQFNKEDNSKSVVSEFRNLGVEIKNNTLLSAITYDKGQGILIDSDHREFKTVKEYFQRELNDPKDNQIKKMAGTGLVIAREKGWIPFLKGKSNGEVAMIADRGVTAVKVAFKVANGELSPTDGINYIIDRNAAAVSTAITQTCRRVGVKVGSKIGGVIGSVFGPAGTAVGTAVGGIVGGVAGTAVGVAISKGVKKVANKAKELASNVWEGAKNVGRNFVSGAKSFISGIFG